ncbi:MAG: hypothetical protein Kow00124_25130 [Anaerolineae bacterium]
MPSRRLGGSEVSVRCRLAIGACITCSKQDRRGQRITAPDDHRLPALRRGAAYGPLSVSWRVVSHRVRSGGPVMISVWLAPSSRLIVWS